jgi:Rod binding domain-containing protein
VVRIQTTGKERTMSEGIKINLPTAVDGSLFATKGAGIINRQSQTKELNVEKVAQDFESFLVFTMMKEMGKTACASKKNFAEDTYMTLMYEKVADYLSKKGLGIKDMLVKYMDDRNIKVFKEKGDNIV